MSMDYLKEKDKNNKLYYYNINDKDFSKIFISGISYVDGTWNLYPAYLHANIITTDTNTIVNFNCSLFLKTDITDINHEVNVKSGYVNSLNKYYIYSNDFNDITVINKDVNGVSNTKKASNYIIEGNEDYSIKFNTFKIDETEQSYDPNKIVYTIKGFQCEFKNLVTIPDGKTIENTENSKDVIFDSDLTLGAESKFIAEKAHVIVKGSLTMGQDADIVCRKLTYDWWIKEDGKYSINDESISNYDEIKKSITLNEKLYTIKENMNIQKQFENSNFIDDYDTEYKCGGIENRTENENFKNGYNDKYYGRSESESSEDYDDEDYQKGKELAETVKKYSWYRRIGFNDGFQGISKRYIFNIETIEFSSLKVSENISLDCNKMNVKIKEDFTLENNSIIKCNKLTF